MPLYCVLLLLCNRLPIAGNTGSITQYEYFKSGFFHFSPRQDAIIPALLRISPMAKSGQIAVITASCRGLKCKSPDNLFFWFQSVISRIFGATACVSTSLPCTYCLLPPVLCRCRSYLTAVLWVVSSFHPSPSCSPFHCVPTFYFYFLLLLPVAAMFLPLPSAVQTTTPILILQCRLHVAGPVLAPTAWSPWGSQQ